MICYHSQFQVKRIAFELSPCDMLLLKMQCSVRNYEEMFCHNRFLPFWWQFFPKKVVSFLCIKWQFSGTSLRMKTFIQQYIVWRMIALIGHLQMKFHWLINLSKMRENLKSIKSSIYWDLYTHAWSCSSMWHTPINVNRQTYIASYENSTMKCDCVADYVWGTGCLWQNCLFTPVFLHGCCTGEAKLGRE